MLLHRLAFILLLLTPTAFAAGVGGQLKATVDSYPFHLGEPVPDLTPYLSFELSQKHRLNRAWRTQWRLLAFGNLAADGPPEKFYADLPEAFVEFKKSDFKFLAGSYPMPLISNLLSLISNLLSLISYLLSPISFSILKSPP